MPRGNNVARKLQWCVSCAQLHPGAMTAADCFLPPQKKRKAETDAHLAPDTTALAGRDPLVLQPRTRSLLAVEAELEQVRNGAATEWLTDPAQDPTEYVGKRVREYFYIVRASEGQTPDAIAQTAKVDVGALVGFNQRRWFPEGLTQSSKLSAGTKLMVPTIPENLVVAAAAATERERHGQNGFISATNFRKWRVEYESGEIAELDEVDVRRACWLFRCNDEGWLSTAGVGDGYVGRRLRLVWDVDTPSQNYTLATVVGYLPQGEDEDDFEMWHVIHDDGDDQDLERHEIEPAIRAFQALAANNT